MHETELLILGLCVAIPALSVISDDVMRRGERDLDLEESRLEI